MRTLGKILLGLLSVVGFFTLLIVGFSIYAVTNFKGGGPSLPSHHTSPSAVSATFVKIVSRRMHSIAFGFD